MNTSDGRAAFEKWHNDTFEELPIWNDERNLYEGFAHHMAWKGWSAALARVSTTVTPNFQGDIPKDLHDKAFQAARWEYEQTTEFPYNEEALLAAVTFYRTYINHMMNKQKQEVPTRLVIVDHRTGGAGRWFDNTSPWWIEYQDEGRTMKVFLTDRDSIKKARRGK